MRMTMIIIIMLIIRLSPSAQVSDDEDESDGQGTVQGDAETQKAVNQFQFVLYSPQSKKAKRRLYTDFMCFAQILGLFMLILCILDVFCARQEVYLGKH